MENNPSPNDDDAEEYITSIINVTIPSFNEKYIDKTTITYYTLNIVNHYSQNNWTLDRRYAEFDTLASSLNALYPSVPSLPGKSLFKISSYEALNKRRLDLEQFMKECVNRKDIMSNKDFKAFIEIDKYCANFFHYSPTLIARTEQFPLGVRDFHYDQNEGVIFLCCSDMDIISRADSILTNFTFPWEEKQDNHIPLGAMLVFASVKYDDDTFAFEGLYAKSFPVETGVINWDPESNLLSVGLDDGSIYFFKNDLTQKFHRFDEYLAMKSHKDRIMGLAFDMHFGYIYSCSTDKKFIMTDINLTSNVQEIMIGSSGFTNLVYLKQHEKIFLTDETGGVYVFATNTFPPSMMVNVQLTTQGCIRGLHLNFKSSLMFTTNMLGKISVLGLPHQGKEKMMNEISTFGGNTKLRVVTYHSDSHEIITGDELGRVTIWSIKDGQSIYAWEAHEKSAITQIYFEENERILWTASKDSTMKIWKLPNKWINEEIEAFEMNGLKTINNYVSQIKMDRHRAKKTTDDNSDSSDDDLNGWEFGK